MPTVPTGPPSTRKSSRHWNADLLKTLSITGVVYIHTCGQCPPATLIPDIQALFRFCVPAFIILAAYFAERSSRASEGWRYHASRIRALLPPFFFWSLVYFLIFADWGNFKPSALLTNHFSGFGWPGQYFFIVLIQVILFFPLLRKLAEDARATVAIIAATLLIFVWFGFFPETVPTILLRLSLRPGIYWFAYGIIGILAARGRLSAIPAWTILLVLLLPLENHLLQDSVIKADPYLRPGVFVASSILTLAFLSTTRFPIGDLPWIEKTVGIIAANTMGIFVLNPLFAMAIRSPRNPFAPAFADFPALPLSFVLTLIVLSASLGASQLIKRLHWDWMLGKS